MAHRRESQCWTTSLAVINLVELKRVKKLTMVFHALDISVSEVNVTFLHLFCKFINLIVFATVRGRVTGNLRLFSLNFPIVGLFDKLAPTYGYNNTSEVFNRLLGSPEWLPGDCAAAASSIHISC